MTIRLVALDLDGTLLTSARTIPDGVLAAVSAAQSRAVTVIVATGRIWPSAEPYIRRLGADIPTILYNGGMVFDFHTRSVWLRVPLAYDHARAVLELLRGFPRVQPHLYVDDQVYVAQPTPLSEAYRRKNGVPVKEVGDLVAFLPPNPMKILIMGAPPDLAEVNAAIAALPVRIHTVFSESTYLEVLPPGSSKGTALEFVARHLAIPREAVLAVGDNLNDLEMIQFAGVGVVMKNADVTLLPYADYVTTTNDEEGVRDVIERFVLDGGR